jgi:hypothetical protein
MIVKRMGVDCRGSCCIVARHLLDFFGLIYKWNGYCTAIRYPQIQIKHDSIKYMEGSVPVEADTKVDKRQKVKAINESMRRYNEARMYAKRNEVLWTVEV